MLLDLMMDDMATAAELYRPTRFWAGCIPSIIEDLRSLGEDTVRAHPSGLRFYVPAYSDGGYLAQREGFEAQLERLAAANSSLSSLWRNQLNGTTEAERDYRIFVAADQDKPPHLQGFSQSAWGTPVEQFHFDGRAFDAAALRYLKCLVFLKKHLASHRVRNVLEIGGGYGALGEIIMSLKDRPYFYVDVDIPPVAYVATRYLQAVYGAEAVATYADTHDLDTIDIAELKRKGFRAAVLCPWQLERLAPGFELFVNTASFQEMEPEVVANYATHVQRLVSDFLILKNSRHGKHVAASSGEIGVNRPTTHADYLRLFDRFQLVAADAATFGYVYGGFESEVLLFRKAT